MDTTATLPSPDIASTDPVALVRSLDADTIRSRLATMERERRALLTLLRAALAARRPTDRKVVANAR